ncbi:hypothetical protein D3C76_389880 [compost metagenome]
MGPGNVPVETDVHHRQPGQGSSHHIQSARDGQLHLVETHRAHPREMRVGQEQASAVFRALRADGHGIAAALEGESLLLGERRRIVRCRALARQRRGLRRHQGFGELANTPLDQQSPGQLDQIQAGDWPHPVTLPTLGGQALAASLTQRAVVTTGVTLQQGAHLRRLGLEEPADGARGIEPGEEQVAGKVIALFDGLALRPKVARAFAIDGEHFVGQQAQVVLGIGIADAVTQAAFILGDDVWHTETGTADLCSGLRAGFLRLRGKAAGDQGSREAGKGQRTQNGEHGPSSVSGVIPIRRMAGSEFYAG